MKLFLETARRSIKGNGKIYLSPSSKKGRLNNKSWCLCGMCKPVENEEACVCSHKQVDAGERIICKENWNVNMDGFSQLCLRTYTECNCFCLSIIKYRNETNILYILFCYILIRQLCITWRHIRRENDHDRKTGHNITITLKRQKILAHVYFVKIYHDLKSPFIEEANKNWGKIWRVSL